MSSDDDDGNPEIVRRTHFPTSFSTVTCVASHAVSRGVQQGRRSGDGRRRFDGARPLLVLPPWHNVRQSFIILRRSTARVMPLVVTLTCAWSGTRVSTWISLCGDKGEMGQSGSTAQDGRELHLERRAAGARPWSPAGARETAGVDLSARVQPGKPKRQSVVALLTGVSERASSAQRR